MSISFADRTAISLGGAVHNLQDAVAFSSVAVWPDNEAALQALEQATQAVELTTQVVRNLRASVAGTTGIEVQTTSIRDGSKGRARVGDGPDLDFDRATGEGRR